MTGAPDPRLILREEELDAALELMLLAEAALWSAADSALEGEPSGVGRSHYRTLFLLKRRPGLGVRELARLTALSKQGASRTLGAFSTSSNRSSSPSVRLAPCLERAVSRASSRTPRPGRRLSRNRVR